MTAANLCVECGGVLPGCDVPADRPHHPLCCCAELAVPCQEPERSALVDGEASSAAQDRDVVSIDDLTVRLEADAHLIGLTKSELRALLGIAEDALALLDLHISEEQRKELGVRIVGRLA